MAAFARIRLVMLSGVACSILAACGADGVASPGEGTIVIPAPTPTPTHTPTPTPTPGTVTPAANCPTIAGSDQLSDLGGAALAAEVGGLSADHMDGSKMRAA